MTGFNPKACNDMLDEFMKEVDVLGKEQLFVSEMVSSLMLWSKVSEILGSVSRHQNVFDMSWTCWDLGMFVSVITECL